METRHWPPNGVELRLAGVASLRLTNLVCFSSLVFRFMFLHALFATRLAAFLQGASGFGMIPCVCTI
jgi:hypothetical protein